VLKLSKHLKTIQRKQQTIKSTVCFSGLGVHTGKQVTIRFCPAPVNTGIHFKRIDLPDQPIIPATMPYVRDTTRNSTTIGHEKALVHTVEHVMAALHGMEIDNVIVEVSNLEPPICDGGSAKFVSMIEEGGILSQPEAQNIVKISSPLYWSEGDIHMVALPYDGYRLSYTLSYPEPEILRAQFHSELINPANFKTEIAPCRTFSRYEEISTLMDRGLIKGGSLDNAVIIKGNAVFSREGLHFPDEMARHKVLDMVGDFALIGVPIHAHVIAIRGGHNSNFQLAKAIYQYITTENS